MHQKKHLVALSAGLIACLLFGVGLAVGQEDAPIAPQLIATTPFEGEEIAPDGTLTLYFNQAMNQEATGAALSFNPPLAGTLAWIDAKTLTFTPQSGWERGKRYAATLGAGALAQNGLPLLAPVSFSILGQGRLAVTQTIPSDGVEGVSADATISLAFNRPVVPLGSTEQLDDLPVPLTIDPPIEGKGEWLNSSLYHFVPSAGLAGGTRYIVTVTAGLTDVSGSALETDYRFSFSTLPPELLFSQPSEGAQVELDSPIVLTFSQAMDEASVEAAFRLRDNATGQMVAGRFTWDDLGLQATFQPSERLNIASAYQLILDAATAKGASGAPLRAGRDYGFTTSPPPFVSSTYPSNGQKDVYPSPSGVSFNFGTRMNPETFRDKYRVEPAPAEIVPYASDFSLGLSFTLAPLTDYTVTLLAGTQDIYGNAIPTDYVLRFRTGDVSESFYLLDSSRFVTTGSYREQTALSAVISATPRVAFSLYRLPLHLFGQAVMQIWDEKTQTRLSDPNELLRRWEETLSVSGGQGTVNIPLAEDGGALPLGLYYLQAEYTQNGYTNRYPVTLGVVNTNLTYKRTPSELWVWASDMQTGAPVVGQNLTIYDGERVLAQGQTDAEGLLRLQTKDWPATSIVWSIVAQSEGRFGLWYNSYGLSPSPSDTLYLYTDRPIYRPGETVYFKGVYRLLDEGANFSLPRVEKLRLNADINFGAQSVYEAEVTLDDFGAFAGEFTLPIDAQIGTLQINAFSASMGFVAGAVTAQVAEFRVPEIAVSVTPQAEAFIQGEALRALVASTYFSGGVVSNAPLTWSVVAVPSFFAYTGTEEGFTFGESYGWWYYDPYGYRGELFLGNGEGMTDADGQFLLDLPASNLSDLGTETYSLRFDATQTDESGQAISASASVPLHPSEVYVGLRAGVYFAEAGEPFSVDALTVTPNSETVAEQSLTLRLIELRWERTPIEGSFGEYTWTQKEIEVESVRLVTDENGLARHTFTAPNAGLFLIRAETRDGRERLHRSALTLWVMGEGQSVFWGQPEPTLNLVADKTSYQVGETAKILIPLSLEGESWLWITLEREGVLTSEVLRVEGSTYLYELPLSEAETPNIYLNVALMHGIDDDNPVPVARFGSLNIPVEATQKRLNIELTPSTRTAQPGDSLTLTLTTTDSAGRPVAADVSLALVDAAVLTLAPPNSAAPSDFFYGGRGNSTYTETALIALIDERQEAIQKNLVNQRAAGEGAVAESAALANGMLPPGAPAPTAGLPDTGGGGGGAGFEQITVREDFQKTAFWQASLRTDAEGRAEVSFTLPDNLTRWTLTARGFTLATQVGQSTDEIASTLPLLVRPAVPRFFVVGDELDLAMVVNNNTEATQNVRTTLQGTGFELLAGETLEQSVDIPAAGRARVTWRVRILDVAGVDLTFLALGAEGFQDASKPTLTNAEGLIPVYRYTAPDTVATAGVLRTGGARTEGVVIPPIADYSRGNLTLQLDPSLAVTALDALEALEQFEHFCIEQTVSRFLPNIATFRALQALGVDDPALEARLRSNLDQALAKIYAEQNNDGGWGWFQGMLSDPLVSAYAALGLIEAQNAGYDIRTDVIERGLAFVRGHFIVPNEQTDVWRLNRQAFYFYVFSRYQGQPQPSLAELDALYAVRLELNTGGLAYLLSAYARYSNSAADQRQALASDLISRAKLSATGAHWEEDRVDWWNWMTDIRSTALALSALLTVDPQNELLPNVVRWLMVARDGRAWQSTQETAWAVISLTDWMLATNELQGAYTYRLSLNGVQQTAGAVSPETTRQREEVVIAVKDLLLDDLNRLTVSRDEGAGALYYTAYLRLRLFAEEVSAINRGVGVTREYFRDGQPIPAEGVRLGDTVTVRLTLNVPETLYYFVLEDPLPAGLEALDTSLLTTSQQTDGPRLTLDENPRWYWYGWVWDKTQIRDERVNLYADVLPPGTYVYTYEARATSVGAFQTLPAHAYAFYFPEVFGRTDGTRFIINE